MATSDLGWSGDSRLSYYNVRASDFDLLVFSFIWFRVPSHSEWLWLLYWNQQSWANCERIPIANSFYKIDFRLQKASQLLAICSSSSQLYQCAFSRF